MVFPTRSAIRTISSVPRGLRRGAGSSTRSSGGTRGRSCWLTIPPASAPCWSRPPPRSARISSQRCPGSVPSGRSTGCPYQTTRSTSGPWRPRGGSCWPSSPTGRRRAGRPGAWTDRRDPGRSGPRVAAQRVVGRNLDEHDAEAIRVLDPHFGQPPGLRRGLAEDRNSGRGEPVALGVDIPHLEPDQHRAPGGAGRVSGDLEQPRAEEEHQPRILGRPELPVDRQPEYVAVETTAAAQVGRAQQDPAAQHLHPTILTAALARASRSFIMRDRIGKITGYEDRRPVRPPALRGGPGRGRYV